MQIPVDRCAHVFATTLGFSSRVYAEVFLDEKLPSFIIGVAHALEYYGAVPKYLVPDNLKTAISMHTKDELILNSAFSDLEDFYDTIVLPPPPRKPKGKPTIENHVRFLETHLIERLKENIFISLDSLNKETQKIIAAINQADFRNKNDIRGTREYAFQTYDKPKMKPLPSGSFTTCDYKYFLRIPDGLPISPVQAIGCMPEWVIWQGRLQRRLAEVLILAEVRRHRF